jgi:hypothetical protein
MESIPRNRFLGINSWPPETFTKPGSGMRKLYSRTLMYLVSPLEDRVDPHDVRPVAVSRREALQVPAARIPIPQHQTIRQGTISAVLRIRDPGPF